MIKFITIIAVFSLICCNEIKQEKSKKPIVETIDKNVVIDLPDNIFLNKVITDTVYYKSPLDTLKLSEQDRRFKIFYIATDSIKYKNLAEIETANHQMFTEKEKGIIPFNITFNRLGDNYFTGIIEDQVIMPKYYPDGKARIITHESTVTIRVWVRPPKQKKI